MIRYKPLYEQEMPDLGLEPDVMYRIPPGGVRDLLQSNRALGKELIQYYSSGVFSDKPKSYMDELKNHIKKTYKPVPIGLPPELGELPDEIYEAKKVYPKYKITRYRWGVDEDSKNDLLDIISDGFWDDHLIKLAGFDLEDEELSAFKLLKPFKKHPKGSILVSGPSFENLPFVILEPIPGSILPKELGKFPVELTQYD